MKLAAAALLAVSGLYAQDSPQLVWEGEVDGTSILHIRGNRVDIEDRQGLPVQRQRHRFFDRLPDSRLTVRLQVVEGRGYVRILEQPRLENNFTLAVAIEDRQGGAGFYSLAFFWEVWRGGYSLPPRSGTISGFGRGERLTWSGRVDDEAIIECRHEACQSRAVRGQAVSRERYQFSNPLPEREVRVSLEQTDGRGEIRLLEQPRPENGYSVRILIRDPQGGSGDYSFSLLWERLSRAEPDRLYARRGLLWSGRVDGRVRVAVQGAFTSVETLSGAPVTGERASFERALPAQARPNATVKKLRGRGRVELVEFPSSGNGYRLVFEIDDSGGGSDEYQVEVGW